MSNSFVGEYAIFDNGANNIPLNKLKINFNPIQTGSGDPSPTNVRPIIGFDRARVSVTKENIFDFHTLVRPKGNNSTPAYEFIENGIHMSYGGSTRYLAMRAPLILTQGVTYRVSCHIKINSLSDRVAIAFRRVISAIIAMSMSFYAVGEYDVEFEWTYDGDPVYLALFGNFNSGGPFDVEFYNISISPIEVNAINKPYFGKNYDILFEDNGIVYGGTLDVLSGELTITHRMIQFPGYYTLSGPSASYNSTYVYANGAIGALVIPNRIDDITSIICTHLKSTSRRLAGTGDVGVFQYHDGSSNVVRFAFPREEQFSTLENLNSWLEEQATNGTPFQICIPLKTPTVVKLSRQEVVSLFEFNQIVAKAYDTDNTTSNVLFPKYNDGEIDIEWQEAKYIDNNSSYTDLVTSEFEKSTKFMSYLETFLDMLSPSVNNLKSFNELFVLDNLIGDRLDVVGSLIGIGRELPIDDSNIPSILSDQTYRLVLKAKILKNHWDGTYEGLMKIMNYLFPGVPISIIDNQDMSYSIVIISTEIDDEIYSLITNGYIFPKPAGVRVNYLVYENVAFGWDSNTELIKGWDLGTWGDS